jgi:hypothetical protein
MASCPHVQLIGWRVQNCAAIDTIISLASRVISSRELFRRIALVSERHHNSRTLCIGLRENGAHDYTDLTCRVEVWTRSIRLHVSSPSKEYISGTSAVLFEYWMV